MNEGQQPVKSAEKTIPERAKEYVSITNVLLVIVLGIVSSFSFNMSSLTGQLNFLQSQTDLQLSSLQNQLNSLQNQLNSLQNQTSHQLNSLQTMLVTGFRQMHDFGHERVATLEAVTRTMKLGNIAFTGHVVVYDDIVSLVTVSHVNNSGIAPSNFVDCHGVDIALSTVCPRSFFALNISASLPLRLGDEVLTYGNGAVAQVCRGSLSGHAKITQVAPPWTGEGSIHPAEYHFEGQEHEGMSGAATLNGCGYVGMSHWRFLDVGYYRVIPAELIIKCMQDSRVDLPKLAHCKDIQVLQPPRLMTC